MEDWTELEIESCAAYYDDNGYIKVLGEIVSTSREPICMYKEVQATVYDAEGNILARCYTNWSDFGIRQSFELKVQSANPFSEPAKVKVFPSDG